MGHKKNHFKYEGFCIEALNLPHELSSKSLPFVTKMTSHTVRCRTGRSTIPLVSDWRKHLHDFNRSNLDQRETAPYALSLVKESGSSPGLIHFFSVL